MKTIRHHVTIKGVETILLFTPRLFEFKSPGMDFSAAHTGGKIAGMYADLAYLAALNYWTLTDKSVDAFNLSRVDFHEWAAQDPAAFGKMMRIAIEAITNKTLEELIAEQQYEEKIDENVEVKKKTCSSIIQRLKHFWLGIVG